MSVSLVDFVQSSFHSPEMSETSTFSGLETVEGGAHEAKNPVTTIKMAFFIILSMCIFVRSCRLDLLHSEVGRSKAI